MSPEKYLRYLVPSALFGTSRTKQILKVNPTAAPSRKDSEDVIISIYDYSEDAIDVCHLKEVTDSFNYKGNGRITWMNIEGIRKNDVDAISEYFGIHPLITEDIYSTHQRPKMDDVEGILYCLLNMLYYDETAGTVEQEQVSIVMGQDFVITFQEDPDKDVFTPIRKS